MATTDTYGLAPLQVQERAVMDTVVIWLPHRKCIVKNLIDCKYYVKHLNKNILNIFSGSSSTTNEPNFKIMCNCIHELLNVFEGSAQREHTILQLVSVLFIDVLWSLLENSNFFVYLFVKLFL